MLCPSGFNPYHFVGYSPATQAIIVNQSVRCLLILIPITSLVQFRIPDQFLFVVKERFILIIQRLQFN
jgi:hypothetical protein